MFQAEYFKYIEMRAKYTKSKSRMLYRLHITITEDKWTSCFFFPLCNLFLLICQWWRDGGSRVGRKKSFALWLLFWQQCQASLFLASMPGLTFLLLPQVLLPFFATRGVLGLFETETFTGNMETSTFWPWMKSTVHTYLWYNKYLYTHVMSWYFSGVHRSFHPTIRDGST